MITAILLVLIYLAFISLGLPDSILGVSLPAMLEEFGIPLSTGGLLSSVVVGSTIISSFLSGHVIKLFGTGKIVFISCLMTGLSLLGFSFAPSFFWLIVLAVPLGLGGGSVDTALNNYVALHYKAHHMNWLHSFWGVGATLGPVLISFALVRTGSWRTGYKEIALIQLSLAFVLFISLSLWRMADKANKADATDATDESAEPQSVDPAGGGKAVFQIPGVNFAFAVMMLYCTVEAGIGLWGSSFLIQAKGYSVERAASFLAFYYGGITVGRFLSGFLSMKLSNRQMIRAGIISALAGLFLLIFFQNDILTGAAIVLVGLGLAPIFPSMLHETPRRFGKDSSQVLIGYQMGFAYVGSAVLSPLLGVMFQFTGMELFPPVMVLIAGGLLLMSELLNRRTT